MIFWAPKIAGFHVIIEDQTGKTSAIADCLSRALQRLELEVETPIN